MMARVRTFPQVSARSDAPDQEKIQEQGKYCETWPHDISHEPTLKIGEVRALLNAEFPFLAASKIRHFENEGLIAPHRTLSNQRLFSLADVERLRFILTEQRDRYTHLAQIKEMLRQLDCGEKQHEHPGKIRAVQEGERAPIRPGTRLTVSELADLTGISLSKINEYINERIITPDARGRLTAQAVTIVRYAELLESEGVNMRQLRSVRTSAHSHAVDIVNMQAGAHTRSTPVSQERVLAKSGDIAMLTAHFYQALLFENVDIELR